MEKRIHSDFLSSKEEHATHILLRLTPSLLPIGTIRGYLIPNTTDTYQLTRLALLKDYRKYGFGRHLVEAFHDWVKSDASSTTGSVIIHPPQPRQIKINCHSQIYAKGFYSKYVCVLLSPLFPIKVLFASRSTDELQSRFGYVPEVWILFLLQGTDSRYKIKFQGEEFIEDGDPHQNMVLYITT